MTKIWCDDFDDDTYTDAKIEDVRSFIGIPLASGRPLGDRFPKGTRVRIRSSGPPADFFMAGPMFVISEKMKTVFEQFHAKVEYFTLEARGVPQTALDSAYYFANLIEVVDCFDWERAEFTEEGGFATDIERLVFKASAIGDQPLFRVARTISSVVATSDALAALAQERGCSGVIFCDPSQWRNPTRPST